MNMDRETAERNYQTALEYLNLLFSKVESGNLVVVEKLSKFRWHHNHFDAVTQREEAAAYALKKSLSHSTYIAWTTHDPIKAKNRKGHFTRSIESALAVPGFALDIDLAGGDHAAQNLPKTPEDAAKLLDKAGVPMPSIILNSGGGLYALWLFREPFVIHTDADRTRISVAMKAFESAARVPFLKAGLKLDAIGELSRILRVPGLINAKYDVAVSYLMRRDERYNLEELSAFAPQQAGKSLVPIAAASVRAATDGSSIIDMLQDQDVDGMQGVINVLTACGFAADCVAIAERGDKIPEPAWKDLVDLLAHLGPAGALAFHLISVRDARYSEPETSGKLELAKRFGPKRCETIAGNGCTACGRCHFAGNPLVGSPNTLARLEAGLLSLQSKWVLDTKTGLFFNHVDGLDKTSKDFNRSFAHLIEEPIDANTVFERSKFSRRVDEHDYRAGVPERFIQDGKKSILNVWNPGGVAAPTRPMDVDAIQERIKIILDHFELMVPIEAERAHVMAYIAHLVRHPAIKIAHALVFQTRQGLGKKALEELICMLLGMHNVKVVFGGVVDGRFVAQLANHQVLILDELDISDKAGGYNKLKRWIDAEEQDVERKGIDPYSARTARGTLIFTNQLLPLKLEKGDRRLFVVRNEAQPREPAYYDRLFAAVNDPANVSAFRAYLDTVSLEGWNPKAFPPETEGKRRLERLSATSLEQELRAMRDDEDGPFAAPVFTAAEVVEELRKRLKTVVNRQQIEELFTAFGDRPLDRRPVHQGKRLRLWVWRDHERVEGMTASDPIRRRDRPRRPGPPVGSQAALAERRALWRLGLHWQTRRHGALHYQSAPSRLRSSPSPHLAHRCTSSPSLCLEAVHCAGGEGHIRYR